MTFSETLRELRKKKGLTQEALGEALSLAPQTVSKWERNESMPDASLLPTLAKTLGCSLDTLFGTETNSWEDAENALIRWVKTIPPEERPRSLMALSAFQFVSLERVWDNPAPEAVTREMAGYPEYARLSQQEGWLLSERRAGKLPYAVCIPDVPAAWNGIADAVAALTPLWELLSDEDGRKAVLHILREQCPLIVFDELRSDLGIEKEETLRRLQKAGLLRPLTLTVDGAPTACVNPQRDPRVLALLLLSRCIFAEEWPNAEKPAE